MKRKVFVCVRVSYLSCFLCQQKILACRTNSSNKRKVFKIKRGLKVKAVNNCPFSSYSIIFIFSSSLFLFHSSFLFLQSNYSTTSFCSQIQDQMLGPSRISLRKVLETNTKKRWLKLMIHLLSTSSSHRCPISWFPFDL